jgi:hypothetical protein
MEQHIRSIIEANNDNRLAIFVGSGISKSSETANIKMPLWKDLIEELKKDLDGINEENYLKLAQLYFLEHGEFLYYDKLKKIFDTNLAPSEIHKLIFEIKPNYVITTNWDKLLDNTIINNAFIYDTVVSDTDLVKSTLQKKLIKMHGDFEHHNIVFKEDDYLNYQQNFPLIENFIKSILSTHTVVFLGYSYSDYNLKQIMKWIQSFSTVKPPAYLISFYQQNSEIKYLENHGIKSLVLNVNNDDYNEAIKNFLLRIKSKNLYIHESSSIEDIINYFYEKLIPFNQMKVLMPEQVKKVFPKVFMRYDENYIILDFTFLTKTNIYYNKFVELLVKFDAKELDNELSKITLSKLNTIFKVLSKAGIGGIMLSENQYYKFEFPIYNGLDINNIINFTLVVEDKYSDLEKAFTYYLLGDNEKSYQLYENTIKESLKSKDYIELFLSMFNRNILLKNLKFDYTLIDKYKDIEEYVIEEQYYNVPNNIKQAISPILLTFKDFSFIYSFAFTVSSLLKEKEDQRKSIEKGSIVFSNNSFESNLRLENLLYYSLGNGLAIDKYTEFKRIIEYFINISITRQIQEDNILLNQIELFSCVSYLQEKELKSIFEPYIDKEKTKRLVLNSDNQTYLLKALANIVKHFRKDDTNIFPVYEEYWKKVIFLFSISKLEPETLTYILEGFIHMLNTSKNSISIYQAINSFLGLQYTLYNEQIDSSKLIVIIELILNKIIYKNYNGHELHAFKSNYISNIYGYLGIDNNFDYDNEELVSKLILELNTWDLVEKLELSKYFLISLYNISNDKVKTKIKDFIKSIDYNSLEDNYAQIDYELFLLINEFIEESDFTNLISKIDNEVSQYRDGKSISSSLYELQAKLTYLVEKREILDFKELCDELNKLIENFDKQRGKSLF